MVIFYQVIGEEESSSISSSSISSSLQLLSSESSIHESSYLRSAIGSATILLTIVGLLYGWEKTVTYCRKEVPSTLKPVLESILGEMGGFVLLG